MEMTLRWFGEDFDSVSLKNIRQIPGVTGIVSTLYDTKPGEVWPLERIRNLKKTIEASGLRLAGIESVNIHDAIKAGLPERDKYIENYIKTLENLGEAGIDMICYNFMPVFDWTRSDLAKVLPDGSTVLSYDQALIDKINPDSIADQMNKKAQGFELPGWEPERMAQIKELFAIYETVTEEQLFDNLVYFLNKIMPTCEKYGIRMAIHPDDPAWPVFGLPRIINSEANITKLLEAVPNPLNGITFCTGSLGSNPENDLISTIYAVKGRIHFAHLRNIKYHGYQKFDEASHLSSDGSLDMVAIIKALRDSGFDGIIRPDHGRQIWDEISMPGYGLYDRALGVSYMNGIWETLEKVSN